MTSDNLTPMRVPLPGRRLSDELDKRGWTQQDLAKIINRPPQTLSEIINGKKQITPETALELSQAFKTTAEFWNRLESDYQLFLAKQNQKTNSISRKSNIFERFPVREMIKKQWIDSTSINRVEDLEKELCRLFGINTIDETPAILANYRSTRNKVETHEKRSQDAWLMHVNSLANQQSVVDIDYDNWHKVIDEVLDLSITPKRIKHIPKLLNSYGIKFVIVQHLSKTYIDGAAFWQDNNPVIALTLRYNRLDNFWFVLMHELAHIYLKHDDVLLDTVISRDSNLKDVHEKIEKEADTQAQEWLINEHDYVDFVQGTFDDLTVEKVLTFSEKIKRHPSIVIGRLQNDGKLHYSQGRQYLEKVDGYLDNKVKRYYGAK